MRTVISYFFDTVTAKVFVIVVMHELILSELTIFQLLFYTLILRLIFLIPVHKSFIMFVD